jgi:hypothetical protein
VQLGKSCAIPFFSCYEAADLLLLVVCSLMLVRALLLHGPIFPARHMERSSNGCCSLDYARVTAQAVSPRTILALRFAPSEHFLPKELSQNFALIPGAATWNILNTLLLHRHCFERDQLNRNL